MTTFVNEIVDASSTIQTTRCGKLLLSKTQVFHEQNILGLSKNSAKKKLLLFLKSVKNACIQVY